MLLKIVLNFALLLFICIFAFPVSAQKKNQRINQKPAESQKQIEQTKKIEQTELKVDPTPPPTGKKNSRPAETNGEIGAANAVTGNVKPTLYVYEFSQPQFVVSHIRLAHDENGKGEITFKKKDLDEEFTDPVQLSAATLERLRTLWTTLNFLDSDENYQMPDRDFSHLGVMKISIKKDGREREAEFNWTANKDAKELTHEYRKISNQYIWMFDITLARENMPLEAPRVMKALESYLRRDEISDPPQMVPFLQELSNDERIPLIARNNAARLIKEIEKKKKE